VRVVFEADPIQAPQRRLAFRAICREHRQLAPKVADTTEGASDRWLALARGFPSVGNNGRSWRSGSSSRANDCESGHQKRKRHGRESKQAAHRLEPRSGARNATGGVRGRFGVGKGSSSPQGAKGQASGVSPRRRESGEQDAPRTTHGNESRVHCGVGTGTRARRSDATRG